jgi:hypothetical protein
MPEALHKSYANPHEAIAQEFERLQQVSRDRIKSEKRRFLGLRAVLKCSPYQRATSREPRVGRNPSFAVGPGQHEARKLAIKALQAFRKAYRAALELWRAGVREAVFPSGTWWMVRFHGAAVREAG